MQSQGWMQEMVVARGTRAGAFLAVMGRQTDRVVSLLQYQTRNGSRLDLPANEPWVNKLCWAFVILGIVIRLVRYLVVYPIWHDEAFLAVNFLDRGFLDLLRPLDYEQVAPVGYLWIELLAVRLLGFHELSLRLFATICGLASVLVFRHFAGRILRGVPLVLAVAVFAVSFYPIRHSAEIKPYASDLLAALLFLTPAVEWWRCPQQSRWLWGLAAISPWLLVVSYPAVLVATAVALALFPEAIRSDRSLVRLAFITYTAVVAASFVAIYFSFTSVQSGALLAYYRHGWWRDSFPPLSQPWKIPCWLLWVHTGRTMAYPIGENAGGSTATFLAVLLGGFILWRAKQATLFRLIILPFGMGLLVACLGRYPYGGPPRVTQYLAPSIIVLAAIGGSLILGLASTSRRTRHSLGVTLTLLAVIGLVLSGRDLICPYREKGDLTTHDFARWFWRKNAREADLLCVKTDLGFSFQPDLWKFGMSAVYLCNQRMFSPPRATKDRLTDPAPASSRRPVRLVFFDAVPQGDRGFDAWMDKLRRSYDVGTVREFVVSSGKPDEMWLRDRYLVIELKPGGSQRSVARSSSGEPLR
jgi:hypothetical protein